MSVGHFNHKTSASVLRQLVVAAAFYDEQQTFPTFYHCKLYCSLHDGRKVASDASFDITGDADDRS